MTLQDLLRFESEFLESDRLAILKEQPICKLKLNSVNEALQGIHPYMYILGGHPGAGKTSLFLQWADELASDGQLVIFVSLEIPRKRIVEKSIARISNGEITVNAPVLDLEAFEKSYELYRENIAKNIIFITEPVDASDISIITRHAIEKFGKKPVVFIDYIQMLPACKSSSAREERLVLRETLTKLRSVINKFEVPIFLVSSISRSQYKSNSTDMSALAESQSLEYGADVVMILNSKGKGAERVENRRKLIQPVRLSIEKNRYGRVSDIDLWFHTHIACFKEVTDEPSANR